MNEASIEPLVPADVDLSGYEFMPLHIDRLLRSKAWLLCKREPALAFYLLNLWMRAWQEKPAGSIEDDDDVLADAAMCEPRQWGKVRERALRGWKKCSDGRLYHPFVAELALDAWKSRQAYRQRTEKARQARAERRNSGNDSSVTEGSTDTVTDIVTASVTENVTVLKGEGQGQREDRDRDTPCSPPVITPDASHPAHAVGKRCLALLGRSDDPTWNYGVVWQWLADGADPERHIFPTIRAAVERGASRRARSLAYFTPAISEARQRNALPAERAQEDQAKAEADQWRRRLKGWKAGTLPWLADWGPEIGWAGCRVPPDIAAEFRLGEGRP